MLLPSSYEEIFEASVSSEVLWPINWAAMRPIIGHSTVTLASLKAAARQISRKRQELGSWLPFRLTGERVATADWGVFYG
jgi:hypothetical protein